MVKPQPVPFLQPNCLKIISNIGDTIAIFVRWQNETRSEVCYHISHYKLESNRQGSRHQVWSRFSRDTVMMMYNENNHNSHNNHNNRNNEDTYCILDGASYFGQRTTHLHKTKPEEDMNFLKSIVQLEK